MNLNQRILFALKRNLNLLAIKNIDHLKTSPQLCEKFNFYLKSHSNFSTLSLHSKLNNVVTPKNAFNEEDLFSRTFALQKRYQKLSMVDPYDPRKEFRNLFFKVHYPEDGKYTIKTLKMTKLAGRDPDTGKIIFGCRGGGHKRRYRWIDEQRIPGGKLESEEPITLVERVLEIKYDPNRTARIAIAGNGERLRYIIATTSMKKGDIITSTNHLPKIPIVPKEGDAHPVGAMAIGTQVCILEKLPQGGGKLLKSAGMSGKIFQRTNDGLIVIKVAPKKQFALHPTCIGVVGQVSNPDHNKVPIGSPNRLRWLGWRPRSGLWQRKDGTKGRKLKHFKGPSTFSPPKEKIPVVRLTHPGEGVHDFVPVTLRRT